MRDYIVGTVLTLLTVVILQLFGCCLVKSNKEYSYKFVIGFIVYSFFVAIMGIPIQIFNLSWNLFFWGMNILILLICAYIVYCLYKKKIILNIKILKEYIKKYWFLYFGAILLLGFALTHISIIWLNNMSDDAYYLNKMATLPYITNAFKTDYATGFYNSNGSGLAYNLSTFEIEASYYIYITNMHASLYARGFLSLLNYFVLLNAIHAFLYTFNDEFKYIDKFNLQYFIVALFFLFVICASFYVKGENGSFSDACWTILSAAYFGSAFIRVGCIFIILLPIVEKDRLDLESVIITSMSCVVMISKSSCSLPILLMLAFGFLFSNCFFYGSNRYKFFFLALCILVCVAGYFLPNKIDIQNYTYMSLINNFKSPIIFVSLLLFILLAFKNKIYLKLLLITIFSFGLLLIPEINDVIENLSFYDFVVGRLLYSWFVFILLITYGYFILYFYDNILHHLNSLILSFIITTLVICVLCFTGTEYTEPILAAKVLKDNVYLLPNSTVLLGETLEKYYNETGNTLKMIMTPGVTVNNLGHFPSQIIRTTSPHTVSITGALRVDKEITNKESEFYGYNLDDAETLNQFIVNPSDENLDKIDSLCEKYPINCIVCNDNSSLVDGQLEKIGFNKYYTIVDKDGDSMVLSYNIFIKN